MSSKRAVEEAVVVEEPTTRNADGATPEPEELPIATPVVIGEHLRSEMVEFMTCKEPFSPEELAEEFNLAVSTLKRWKAEAEGKTYMAPVFTKNGQVDDRYRKVLAEQFSGLVRKGCTQEAAAKQLGKSRTALARWCERFGLSTEPEVQRSRKQRMRDRRAQGKKAREFVMEKTAESWFSLCRWGAESGYFTYNARSQCYRLAQKIKLGHQPSASLSIPCAKHWETAEALGWRP